MSEQNKLKELETLLKNHDWDYVMSDDMSKFLKGEREMQAIQRLVRELGVAGEELYRKIRG